MLADRIKAELPEHVLRHVIGLESRDSAWLKPDRLSAVVDDYIANLGYGKTVGAYVGQLESRHFTEKPQGQPRVSEKLKTLGPTLPTRATPGSEDKIQRHDVICYNCRAQGHVRSACPLLKSKALHVPARKIQAVTMAKEPIPTNSGTSPSINNVSVITEVHSAEVQGRPGPGTSGRGCLQVDTGSNTPGPDGVTARRHRSDDRQSTSREID